MCLSQVQCFRRKSKRTFKSPHGKKQAFQTQYILLSNNLKRKEEDTVFSSMNYKHEADRFKRGQKMGTYTRKRNQPSIYLDISQMLTLNTKHIKKETACNLLQKNTDIYGMPIYRKEGCGWLIHIPENQQGVCDNIPRDLKGCIDLASKNGCEWLCLDRKGKETDLPVYTWEDEAGHHNICADNILVSREAGILDKVLPSGTNIPFSFENGEKNSFDVGRDKDHTYLILHDCMSKKHAINPTWTNKGGWPACTMREYMQHVYDILPNEIRKAIIPMHIQQTLSTGDVVESEDMAFLLSEVNVFGNNAWASDNDECNNSSQIDIFRSEENRVKVLANTGEPIWWWLRSPNYFGSFISVGKDGDHYYVDAFNEGGVVVGFCIENRHN